MTYLSDGDLAQLRSLLLSAAAGLEFPPADRAGLIALLRTTADDLQTPEQRARRVEMHARLVRAGS